MKIRLLEKKVEALYRHLLELEQVAKTSSTPYPVPLKEILEESHNILEELRVADKGSEAQNEELESGRRAIEEEHRRYVELFEFAPDGYVITDAHGVIREANKGASLLLNVHESELIGKPLVVYITGKEHAAFHTLISQLQTGAVVAEQEIHLQPREKPSCPVSVTVSALLDPKGKTMTLRWLLRDISLRKQTEEKLSSTMAQLHGIISSAMDAIITVDEDGCIVMFNAAAERMFRYPAREAIGQPLGRFIPERFRGIYPFHFQKTGWTQVLSQAIGRLEKFYGLRANGEEFPAEASVSQIIVGGKKYFTLIQRDITDRKRADAALRVSELRYRSVAQSANAAIISADDRGTITSWNTGAQNIFGYKEAEVLGRPLTLLMPERYLEAHQKGMARLLSTGESRVIGKPIELHGIRKDAMEFPLELSLSTWSTDEGTFFTGIIQDITDRKRAEDQVKQSLQQVRLLAHRLEAVREEERTRIAREVHDELGVTLTCLKFDLSKVGALASKEPMPATQALLQHKIQGMLQQIDNTIVQIQRLATELRPGVLDDLGLVAAIEWQARDFASRTGITCHFRSIGEDFQPDESRAVAMFRICQEALTNVARHAQATSVTVRLWEEGGTVILEVKDDGRGIPKEKIADMRSLGLVGMRERVMPFGGEVSIIGAAGSGTFISVKVPLEHPPLEENGRAE